MTWRGSGCVLVIDDEPGVRRVVERILERCGLKVLLAETGRRGLEILASGASVDAVLLDMTMPEMDGSETFAAIREDWPQLPIVVCSGYSRDDVRLRFATEPAFSLVEKPFSSDTLIEAIRTILDG